LLELVWPELDGVSGRHSLRQHLYRLRQLGVEIDGTRAAVRLGHGSLVPSFSLDRSAALFDRDVLRGHEPFGHLFAGWLPSQLSMRRWVERQRDLYHTDVRRILVPELRRLRDRGDWEECERWARTVLEFDPFNEDATVIVAEAVAMLGSRIDASSLLDEYVRETGAKGTDLGRRVERTQQRIQRASRVLHGESAAPLLIGRDRELSQLDLLTLSAMRGESQVVQLIGPAGIGKTELGYEATRRAVILGFARCIVRVSRPVGQVTHGTLSRLTRDLISLPGSLGCKPENLRLLRQFAGLEVGVGERDLQTHTAAPLTECLFELISCVSDERPLFILIDDLDYVDQESLEFLERLFDLLRGLRVVVVTTDLTSVPGQDGHGEPKPSRTRLFLPVLSPKASTLLATMVRTPTGRTLGQEAAEKVALASDRSPLQVITLAREQLSSGLTHQLSPSLHESLRMQLQRLSQEARVVLQCLAVVGGRAAVADLDLILQLSLRERVSAIGQLLETGLIDEIGDGLVQCHDEVLSAALSNLSPSQKQMLQRGICRCFSEELAREFDADKAITALRVALAAGDKTMFVELCASYSISVADAGLASGMLRFLEIARTLARTPKEHETILSRLAIIAHRTSNWGLVLKSARALRHIQEKPSVQGSELLLAELEASLRAELLLSGRENAQIALQLAREKSLDPALRVRAVRLVVVSASDLFEADLAISAFLQLDEIPGVEFSPGNLAIEPYMQYHTVFGDLAVAVEMAREMSSLRGFAQLTPFQGRLFGNACFVLRLAGETQKAMEWLDYAYHCKALSDDPGRRAFVAWQLSLIAADANDVQSASIWAGKLDALASGQLGASDELWVLLHRQRMQLIEYGEVLESKSILQRIDGNGKSASRALLYAIGLSLRSTDFPPDSQDYAQLLKRAERYLREFARYGGQDLLASTTTSALFQRGDEALALDLATTYISTDRRELSSPMGVFAGAADSLRLAVDGAFVNRRVGYQLAGEGRVGT